MTSELQVGNQDDGDLSETEITPEVRVISFAGSKIEVKTETDSESGNVRITVKKAE